MNKKEITKSDSELYNDMVEMLSNGNFLQLNGKAINLTELNEYINAQNEEIERLQNIIKEVREYIEKHKHLNWYNDSCYMNDLLEILDKENEK